MFQVALDVYRGPLDLLLFLVRKQELSPVELPLAELAGQFYDALQASETTDVDAAAEFLVFASSLLEMKARLALPRIPVDEGDLVEDPTEDLVVRLLEYKRYRDAATILEERSRRWQLRYVRLANDLPPRELDLADAPIRETELWDLVSVVARLTRDREAAEPRSIVYDDTPIESYMTRIRERLDAEGEVPLSSFFRAGMHKSALIGLFVATLELVRHCRVCTEQRELHGEIWIRRSGGETPDPNG